MLVTQFSGGYLIKVTDSESVDLWILLTEYCAFKTFHNNMHKHHKLDLQ